MKRTRIMGLCLMAVCAMFALTASSALAENLPHYGQCVAKAGGVYSTATCTKVKAGTNSFEWIPLTTTVAFSSKKETGTGEAVLESHSGTKIHCTGQEEKVGEYGPGDQVKNVVGEFSGCEALGFKCNSEGLKEGLINTKKLKGEPGIVKKEAKTEKNIDGNDLAAETSKPDELTGELAEFSCGGAPVLVRGGVVVKAQADSTGGITGELTNKMANKIEVEFVAETGGKQVPSEWTPNGGGITHNKHEKLNEHLESSLSGGAFEESGQTLTTVQSTTGTKPKVELRQCEENGKTAISCPN